MWRMTFRDGKIIERPDVLPEDIRLEENDYVFLTKYKKVGAAVGAKDEFCYQVVLIIPRDQIKKIEFIEKEGEKK